MADVRGKRIAPQLVVEQTDASEAHDHVILVASSDDMIVAYRPTRLCYIFHTALVCALNIVSKWEECI